MIKYLIKFVSKKEYADDLIDGKLYMHTAKYFHNLEKNYGTGQGDLREGQIFPDIAIYKAINIPIYCLYSVLEKDIEENGNITVSNKCINDFNCSEGYIIIIKYDEFCNKLKELNTSGYRIDYGLIEYKTITQMDVERLFDLQNIDNLFIKYPYFSYQKEFRIIALKQILNGDNIVYKMPNISNFSEIIPISNLSKDNYSNYIVKPTI